jgi:hypothetical protein
MKRLLACVALIVVLVLPTAVSAVSVPPSCDIPMLPGHIELYQTSFEESTGWNTAADQFVFWGLDVMNTASEISGGTLHSGSADKSAARLDLVAVLGRLLDLSDGPLAFYIVVDSQGLSHDASDPTVVLHKFDSGHPGYFAGISLRPAGAAGAVGCQDSMGEKNDHGNVGDGTNTVVVDSPGVYAHDDPQTFAVLLAPLTGPGRNDMSLQFYQLVAGSYELKMDNTAALDPMNTVFQSDTVFDYLDVCFRSSSGVPSITLVDCLAISQVPEPATVFLLGLGGLALLRRKRV